MTEIKVASLPVTGMDCANCATAVERIIKKVAGVDSAQVNLTTERATIKYNPDITAVSEIIKKIEKKVD